MRFMKRLLVSLAMITAGLMLAASAQAESISYNLTSDHCTGGCGPLGTIFGVVTLTTNGGNVDVTVHLNSPYGYAKTGSVDFQAFKFNGVGIVLGDISVDPHVPGLVAATGAFNGDGTGNFSFGINCPTCANGLSSIFFNDIVFHVASATIADLTAPNALGNVFVADVGNPITGVTGPVDATVPTTVPEPSALLLAGTALLGIGYSIRHRIFRRTEKELAVS